MTGDTRCYHCDASLATCQQKILYSGHRCCAGCQHRGRSLDPAPRITRDAA